jgi:hypothetical protein
VHTRRYLSLAVLQDGKQRIAKGMGAGAHGDTLFD